MRAASLFAAVLAALALISFGGKSSQVHRVDSGGLLVGPDHEITLPGAAKGLQAIVLDIEFDRAFAGWYANGPAPTSGLFLFDPSAELDLPVPVVRTLTPFALPWALGPGQQLVYSTPIEDETLSVTFTDAASLAFFTGREVAIPLEFRGGYSLSANGGQGSSGVSSSYGWSGSITYTY